LLFRAMPDGRFRSLCRTRNIRQCDLPDGLVRLERRAEAEEESAALEVRWQSAARAAGVEPDFDAAWRRAASSSQRWTQRSWFSSLCWFCHLCREDAESCALEPPSGDMDCPPRDNAHRTDDRREAVEVPPWEMPTLEFNSDEGQLLPFLLGRTAARKIAGKM